MEQTLPKNLTLLVFVLVTTVGGFSGGWWAGSAIALSVLLFLLAWWRDSRPALLPSFNKPLFYGAAATLGVAALLLFVPPLRLGLRLLKPRRLLQLAWPFAKTYGKGFALKAIAGVRPKRSWADVKAGLPRPDRGFAALAVLALAVMALANLHSTHPAISWRKALQLATIWLPLLALTCPAMRGPALHPRLFYWLPATIALTALLLSVELGLGGPLLQYWHGLPVVLTQYNRGASYLVLAALPAMAGLWLTGRRLWLVPFVLILLLLAGETESRAAKLGLLLALPVMGLALWRVPVAAAFLAILPPALVGWPLLARVFYHHHQPFIRTLPASWQARLEIWDYVSYRIAQHPFLGWGLGTSHFLNYWQPDGATYRMIHGPADHPHNAVLQLWAELGMLGLLLGLGFAFYTLYRATRLDRRLAPFALGGWVVALTLSLCAFDFWNDAGWGCLALTGFAFSLLDRQLRAGEALAAPAQN